MDGGLGAREKVEEVVEPRIAARVPAAADGDPGHLVGDLLQPGQDIVAHRPEALEALVVLPHAPGAVIAADREGRAVPAAEGLGLLHVPEVAVLTVPPAVQPRPAPDVHGELRHYPRGLPLNG